MAWYTLALIAAFSGAIVGLLQKKTLQREHTVEYITMLTVTKLCLFLLAFGPSLSLRVSYFQLTWLIVAGLMGSLGFFLIAKAIRHVELTTVLPLLTLEPGFTVLLAYLALGETVSRFQLSGILLLLIGAYVLELHRHPHGEKPADHRRFLLPFRELASNPAGKFAFWALGLLSISSVVDRFLLQQIRPTTYTFYTLTTMAVVYVLLFLGRRKRVDVFQKGNRRTVLLIVAISIAHLTSIISQATAVSLVAVGLVVSIKRLSILMDVIVGGRLFHEHHLKQKIAATVIMLLGVAFLVRP